MFLHAFLVCAIGIMVSLFLLYIYTYFHYVNRTAEIERKRQKRRTEMEELRLARPRQDQVLTEQLKGIKSLKYVPHGGWNFASSPTVREDMAESFQNSQLNSTHASGTKKRIRENS